MQKLNERIENLRVKHPESLDIHDLCSTIELLTREVERLHAELDDSGEAIQLLEDEVEKIWE
jgi:uncharacterized small protein (DUF1192 family)